MPGKRRGDVFFCEICDELFQRVSADGQMKFSMRSHENKSAKHKRKLAERDGLNKRGNEENDEIENGQEQSFELNYSDVGDEDDDEEQRMNKEFDDETDEKENDDEEDEEENDDEEEEELERGERDEMEANPDAAILQACRMYWDEDMNEDGSEGNDDSKEGEDHWPGDPEGNDDYVGRSYPSSLGSINDIRPNEIWRMQKILLNTFINRQSCTFRFNKVNGGEVVNTTAALHIVDYVESSNLTEKQADGLLKHDQILHQIYTNKALPMVQSYKTLKRVFLLDPDTYIPLSTFEMELPPAYFDRCLTKKNKKLPPIRGLYVSLETALAFMLLKMNPREIEAEMKPEFIEYMDAETGETVKDRIYQGWKTSQYAYEVQAHIFKMYSNDGIDPLIIYLSVFMDGGSMNANNTRSATPISIYIQNYGGKKCEMLIGFVPEDLPLGDEVLTPKLVAQGFNKTAIQYILQYTKRQITHEYIDAIFGTCLSTMESTNGFDVQIGTGKDREFHRIFVVPINYNGDNPQLHAIAGVSTSACNMCMCKNFQDFRVNGQVQGMEGEIPPRNPQVQREVAKTHAEEMAPFLNKEPGVRSIEGRRKRIQVTALLEEINGHSGDLKGYTLFNDLIDEGTRMLVWLAIVYF